MDPSNYIYAHIRMSGKEFARKLSFPALPADGDRIQLREEWYTVSHVSWQLKPDAYGGTLMQPTIHILVDPQ